MTLPDPHERPKIQMDLWIGWGDELSVAWREDVQMDFDLFHTNDEYATRVSNHIAHVLSNLAREIVELSVATPAPEDRVVNCD